MDRCMTAYDQNIATSFVVSNLKYNSWELSADQSWMNMTIRIKTRVQGILTYTGVGAIN